MKGKYTITVHDNLVSYSLELERKITVIKGESGIGKSHMYSLLTDLAKRGKKSGVKCNMTSSIVVLSVTSWEKAIADHDKIIFADEMDIPFHDRDFQEAITHSNNYFVLITRSAHLYGIGYAISNIYTLTTEKSSGVDHHTKLCELYAHKSKTVPLASTVITEDSKSGYIMMCDIVGEDIHVVSAGGKDNVYNYIKKLYSDRANPLCIFVDGAAFGARFSQVLAYSKTHSGVFQVLAPESFEWLLLQTSVFNKKLNNELTETWEYCDTTKFSTWEQYYTSLITELLRGTKYPYTKEKLSPLFRTAKVQNNIKSLLSESKIFIVIKDGEIQ